MERRRVIGISRRNFQEPMRRVKARHGVPFIRIYILLLSGEISREIVIKRREVERNCARSRDIVRLSL